MKRQAAVYLCVLVLLLGISLTFRSAAAAGPIVWKQAKSNQFTDFNGCVDTPSAPNPAQVKDMPINFTNKTTSGSFIVIYPFIDWKVTLGGCVAAVQNSVVSITDDGGTVYSRVMSTTVSTVSGSLEMWVGNTTAQVQLVTIHFDQGHLHVSAHMEEFTGVFTYTNTTYQEPAGVSGAFSVNVTWTDLNSVYYGFEWANQGATGCNGFEPDCAYPATNANAGTGGYNENNLTVACTVCNPANVNSNGKTGGGDNRTNGAIAGVATVFTQRISTIATGGHKFYVQTFSPTASIVGFIGVLLTPQTVAPCQGAACSTLSDSMKGIFLPFIFFALMFTMLYLAYGVRNRRMH